MYVYAKLTSNSHYVGGEKMLHLPGARIIVTPTPGLYCAGNWISASCILEKTHQTELHSQLTFRFLKLLLTESPLVG